MGTSVNGPERLGKCKYENLLSSSKPYATADLDLSYNSVMTTFGAGTDYNGYTLTSGFKTAVMDILEEPEHPHFFTAGKRKKFVGI